MGVPSWTRRTSSCKRNNSLPLEAFFVGVPEAVAALAAAVAAAPVMVEHVCDACMMHEWHSDFKFLYGELGVLACNPLHFPFRRHQPGTSAAAGAAGTHRHRLQINMLGVGTSSS